MSRVWTSENEEQQIYMKLEPEKIYQIINVKTIQTKYGEQNILTDYLTNEYFSTKQIDKFLNANKGINKFVLRTLKEKEFETKDKKIVKYFDVEIRY